ncbi:unnamed protein product [Mytilus coruscus]|uniref:DDE-1 domain-containing protein n=1 Tax=Mytilus coruscus TaxID=42192 RepID=A0A6J8A087_MYTCO|nr:unnamed protein product [Mytilus coruscus]
MHHWGHRHLEVGLGYRVKREPENPKDPNAVAILYDGERKAYLKKNHSFVITRILKMNISNVIRLKPKEDALSSYNNTPSKDWWYGFKGRNPTVTIRSPEKRTSIRARALNSVKVGEYFLDLKKEMNRLGLNDKPELVWNMDEKSVPLEHTSSKVVAAKSSRTIPGRVSNTRERNTIVGCINARGDRLPPLIIV